MNLSHERILYSSFKKTFVDNKTVTRDHIGCDFALCFGISIALTSTSSTILARCKDEARRLEPVKLPC